MASVSWDGKHSKCKTVGQARLMLQHFDPRRESRERIKQIKEKKGEITHIRPDNARFNLDLYVDPETGSVYSELIGEKSPGSPVYSSYEVSRDRHKKELERLDSLPGQNKRKNRVINQLIEVPAPDWLQFDPDADEETKQKQAEALKQFYSGLLQRWIKEGVISPRWVAAAVVHLDEVHVYRDAETGTKRDSHPHLHLMIFPVDEKEIFSSKKILTRTRIIKSNDVTNNFCRENYGKNYGTGSKRKSKKSVQKLKQASAEKAAEAAAKEADALSVVVEELREKEREQRERVEALRSEADAREELKAILDDLKQYRADMESQEPASYKERLRAYIEEKANKRLVPYFMQYLDNFEAEEKARKEYETKTAARVDYLTEKVPQQQYEEPTETETEYEQKILEAMERQRAERQRQQAVQKPVEAPRTVQKPAEVEIYIAPTEEPQRAPEAYREPTALEEWEEKEGRRATDKERAEYESRIGAIVSGENVGRNTYGLRTATALMFKGLDIEKAIEEYREKEAKTERKSTRKGYSFY